MKREGLLPHSKEPANRPNPESHQYSPRSHHTSWRSIVSLSSHLLLGLPSGPFPLDPPTKTMYALRLSPTHATCQPISVFWFVHPNDIWWGVQSIKLLDM